MQVRMFIVRDVIHYPPHKLGILQWICKVGIYFNITLYSDFVLNSYKVQVFKKNFEIT